MDKNILVFIPNNLNTNKSGFIEGVYKSYTDVEAYYITNDETLSQCKNAIGYTGRFLTPKLLGKNTIFLETNSQNIHINSQADEKHYITKLYYDLEAFKSSDVVYTDHQSYGVHIKELTQKLNDDSRNSLLNGNKSMITNFSLVVILPILDFLLRILSKTSFVVKNCATLLHFENNLKTTKWFLKILSKKTRKSTIMNNIILAKIVDLILGMVLIYYCLEYEDLILKKFRNISEDFVAHLRKLLIYLMGSPIGLKLNYAFNHSLGRFFFYHINLWRVFLQAMQPLLVDYFKILLVPAIFGISYQIALFCDIISIATFHVYCIYVYAARLFSLQIQGLASLWHLFIGRKYNPLRLRVDSCEYSSNQLFIGTLGFTILLFLLPTTTMYYTVFATFRLVTLLLYTFFTKVKEITSSVPLYIILLWVLQSPSLAGTIEIDWLPSIDQKNQVKVTLTPLSLTESIRNLPIPSFISQEKISLVKTIQHLFIGKLV